MQHRRLIIILISSATILLIPLIAMQFTEEVNWSMLDFMVAGVLVLGAGLMFDLVIRKVKNIKHRAVVHAALVIAFLLIWAELAVGIFGTPLGGQ